MIDLNKYGETELSFDEYRNQEVAVADDGIFEELDKLFGIVPGTDKLIADEENEEQNK